MHQFENDLRSERTRAGMREAAERGQWCWPASVGYVNRRAARCESSVPPSARCGVVQTTTPRRSGHLEEQLTTARKRKRWLLDLVLDGTLDPETFKVPRPSAGSWRSRS